MISRRKFLINSIGLAGATYMGSVFTSCSPSHKVTGILTGPNQALGHRLHQEIKNATIEHTLHHDIVIVGGGASGLAAARYLAKSNTDFLLIELEQRTGGNAQYGSNAVSSYPLGAHYLPLPSTNDKELLSFLEECGAITGYEKGLPIYNEYYLCFDPKERLYIHGHWQEGLVPHSGIPDSDVKEIERFQALMHFYKSAKGADGKDAFLIPVSACSSDPAFTALDNITFATFLSQQGFTSQYLTWYVNYCCTDDYGATANEVSAWAGIHYFASRKGNAANATADTVLTWPEGNGWLIKQLDKHIQGKSATNSLVFSVGLHQNKASVKYIDGTTGVCTEVIANKVIMATPQFINHRILSPQLNRTLDTSAFAYAPWMVANLTLNSNLETKRGEPLCWDNVIYGSNSLGYVYANHQLLNRQHTKQVITYYAPLVGSDMKERRQFASAQTYEQWYSWVMNDLKKPHQFIEEGIENLDVWVWGHGMICPRPGYLFGEARAAAASTIQDKIYFAHSDCSGISIFEEAFHRGTHIAKQVLGHEF